MLENIDIHSSVPVYVQIENEIRFAIASGRLKTDDRLPSVRELSERIKVNPNTVAKSYRDLEVMGYVYTRQGMGVYINKGVAAKCREDCYRSVISRMHEVISEAKAAGFTQKDIKEVCTASLAIDSCPYGETPKSLMDIAKKVRGSK
jgi:GntR family transcriptional regulator